MLSSQISNKLIDLYNKRSKHSNYQVLPSRLSKVISSHDLKVGSRAEWQRLKYIKNNSEIECKTILDIGGNSGFFSFELIELGALSTHLFEGNEDHAEFAKIAAKYIEIENIKITHGYFDFDNPPSEKYDLCLLLNVLHHVGDDYGSPSLSIVRAKALIAEQLRKMAPVAKVLILQLGFNWKGDVGLPLFSNGTKGEVIDFVSDSIKNSEWELEKVAVYDENSDSYESPTNKNLARLDHLGEFLNRPIFVLRSVV